MTPLQTKVGDRVRPCFPARMSDQRVSVPLVRARLGNPFTVDAISGGCVRIKGNTWLRSWVLIR